LEVEEAEGGGEVGADVLFADAGWAFEAPVGVFVGIAGEDEDLGVVVRELFEGGDVLAGVVLADFVVAAAVVDEIERL